MPEFDHIEHGVGPLHAAGGVQVYASVNREFFPNRFLKEHADRITMHSRFRKHMLWRMRRIQINEGTGFTRSVATIPVTHAGSEYLLRMDGRVNPGLVVYLIKEHFEESQDVFSYKYPNYIRITPFFWMKVERLPSGVWLLDAERRKNLTRKVPKGTLFFTCNRKGP